MDISRYTWPVIIAAGLHGALLLSFAGKTSIVASLDPVSPKWESPPSIPVELETPEPETSNPGEKSGSLASLPASPEIIRPLTDDTVFTMPITERLTPIDPVKNLKDYRGGPNGSVIGPTNLNLQSIPRLEDLDRIPRAIMQPPPGYPDSFRRDSINGSVTVEFLVDTTGRVVSAEAIRWSHREFVEPAVRGVLRWRFEPGMLHGRKVRFWMAVPIEFNAVL